MISVSTQRNFYSKHSPARTTIYSASVGAQYHIVGPAKTEAMALQCRHEGCEKKQHNVCFSLLIYFKTILVKKNSDIKRRAKFKKRQKILDHVS